MNVRRLITGIIVLAAVLAVGAYVYLMFFGPAEEAPTVPATPTQATSQQDAVRIGSFSTAIDYAPLLVAKAQKRFETALGAATRVEFRVFDTLPTINEALATGRLDIVFEAEPPVIVGAAAGIDLAIAAVSCSLNQEIVVPTDSPVRSVSDLARRKIAVLAGTSSHYGLLKAVEAAGVPKTSIEVVDMAPPDAKAAFAKGLIDAWAVWPPWVEQELVAGNGRALQGGDAKIHSVMAIRRDFVRASPDLARITRQVIEETKDWLAANPAEAQQVVARELDLPLEVVALAWPKHDWRAQLDPTVLADIQAKADFLLAEGLVRRRVDVSRELIIPNSP